MISNHFISNHTQHWPGDNTNVMQLNNERIQQTDTIISSLQPGLHGDDPPPQLDFLRGVFLANHLASTDNLTGTTKRQNTY